VKKEKITFQVTVEIGYEDPKMRSRLINEAKQGVTCYSSGGGNSYLRPNKTVKIIKKK